MCPVVFLAMLFSMLMLLLELTAAINVTFKPTRLKKILEEEERLVYFDANVDKAIAQQDEKFYKVISSDPGIARVTNVTFNFNDHAFNGTFVVRANFLGKTSVNVQKQVNGTVTEKSESLDVTVVRKVRAISKAFTISVAVLVSLNYINMGCALDLSVVKSVLLKPIAPGVGFFCQYAIMPLIAFGLAKLLFDDVILQLGLFTFGCSPGGGASNMWTVLLKGNLNLSLTMTFISGLAAFVMMPLWLFTLGSSLFSQVTTKLPFVHILMTLVIMLFTLGIGLLFQRFLPRVAKFCRRILAPVSILMILFIIVFGTYANLYMFKLFTYKIVIAAMANVWLGFLFGAIISKACNMSLEDLIAISVETGVQNTGIAIVLLGISLGQPEADLASVVPVAASIMTPFPLLVAYCYLKIRSQLFKKPKESHLYVLNNDDEEKRTLPSQESADSLMSSKNTSDYVY